jgi:hypothetical protein
MASRPFEDVPPEMPEDPPLGDTPDRSPDGKPGFEVDGEDPLPEGA